MKTAAHALNLAAVCLLAALQAPVASAQQPSLENLVRLSRNASTARRGGDELARLRRADPADARVPYVYSLVLIDRLQFVGALEHVQQAVALDPSNLNAWKLRIWLAVSTRDFDDALQSMETLATRMPRSTSPAAERICCDFSSFMGTVFGYLSGPQADNVSLLHVGGVERRIVGQLSPSRRAAFQASRDRVEEEFESRVAQLSESRQQAIERESESRRQQLENLSQEQQYVHAELNKIEELRLAHRQVAANERNVIAATREHSAGGTRAGAVTGYRDAAERNPTYHRSPDAAADAPYQQDHEYDRYRSFRHRRGLVSGFVSDRGLDDRHYADVNRRDAQSQQHLADRERTMQRRLRRIAKDQAKQTTAPNGGSSPHVRALVSQARALTTYLELPVTVGDELRTILAAAS